ncbi:exosortase U [Crateriforma conspicua]|uniref:exosortase U n=1 Tax=Crateriforma conspicua TaxID=2527996 RepID=UPI001189B5BB|nr:exosortase U [Crateriforma conspicua]QDV65953.1 Transmembrane exosortase (Exosortase_EpsH) [Crateriforma conspicua]
MNTPAPSTAPAAASPVDRLPRLSPAQWAVAAAILVTALAVAPPAVNLIRWMVSREYYEHMPWLMLAAAVLAGFRLRANPTPIDITTSWRVMIWTGLAMMMTAGVYILPSRWMAGPAVLSLLMATIHFVGGTAAMLRMRGPMILFLACLPLPVLLDSWFVVRMQQLATWLASVWLDLFGVLHLATGVDIRTPGNNFVVEDACSGIHSMFAAITVGVGYGVLMRYRWYRILAIVVQMVFWVVVANAIRVFTVVYVQSQYGTDLSTGTPHQMIGLATFALGLLLAISSDHFFRYLHPPKSVADDDDDTPADAPDRLLDRPASARGIAIVLGGLAAVAVIGVLAFSQYSRMSKAPRSMQELAATSAIRFDAVGQDYLPAELAGWRQTGFDVNEKTADSIFGGMKSFIWRYTKGARSVLISLDGPYGDWHDLALCYSGVGWDVESRTAIDIADMPGPYKAAELNLDRPPFDRAQVLFACFDPRGASVDPPPDFGDAFYHLVNRLRWGVGDKQDYGGGVVQIQLLDQTPVELSTTQRNRNRELFEAVVRHAFGDAKGAQ